MSPTPFIGRFESSARLASVLVALSLTVACANDGKDSDVDIDSGGDVGADFDITSDSDIVTDDGINPFDDSAPMSPGSEPTTQDPISPIILSGAANGPLTGRLITSADFPYRNALVALDLQTGSYSLLEGADSADSIRRIDNDETDRAFVADYSAPGRFVETQTDCAGVVDVRCFVFRGAGANIESGFSVSEPGVIVGVDWGMAKRSRDGRFVASLFRNSRFLEIRTITGEVVSSVEYGFNPNSAYDWLPDGSIVIKYEPDGASDGPVQLALTEPYSASTASFITLPEHYEGLVLDIAIDPSGTRIALSIKPEAGNSLFQRPVVLDLDTNRVYEPVESGSDTDILRSVDLHWSPDGQWLIFRDANYAPVVPLNLPPSPDHPIFADSRAGRTYAVRADGGSYQLPEESSEKVRVVLARPVDNPNGSLSPDNATSGDVWVD